MRGSSALCRPTLWAGRQVRPRTIIDRAPSFGEEAPRGEVETDRPDSSWIGAQCIPRSAVTRCSDRLLRDRRQAGSSVAVLVQNSIIMVAGADSHSTPDHLYPSSSSGARRPDSGDDGPGEEDRWLVVPTGKRAVPASERWRRLVRSLFRIRSLQRIWGNLGQWLQQVASKDFRDEIRALL